MKEMKPNKRFFKIFVGSEYEQVFDKVNSFSKNQQVIILNYEFLPSPADTYKVLIFYSLVSD